MPQLNFGTRVPEPGSWDAVVWEDYWEARIARASTLLGLSSSDATKGEYAELAAQMLARAIEQNPQLAPHIYKMLAVARSHPGLVESAEGRRRAADAWRQYVRHAPKSDAELPEIEEQIARLTEAGSDG